MRIVTSRSVAVFVATSLTGASALAQGYIPPSPYAGVRLTVPFHATSPEATSSFTVGAGFRQADLRFQPGFAAREHLFLMAVSHQWAQQASI
jgi:hypothetical protein